MIRRDGDLVRPSDRGTLRSFHGATVAGLLAWLEGRPLNLLTGP